MPFDNNISRQKAEALIREQVVDEIIQHAPEDSAFLALARRLPDMTSNQTRMRVLDTMPIAYWVDGDTGFKQTADMAWDNVYINAAELAVIVPIPEAVLEDADIDIVGEITPRAREAFGKRVDEAAIFNVRRPNGWPLSIIDQARQAGNNVAVNSTTDYFEAILGENGLFAKVEQYGADVNGTISGMGMRAKLRGLRDQIGNPIFMTTMQGATPYALDGAPMYFPKNGAFATNRAQIIAGDWSKAVYSIRKDVSVKILTEATIVDPETKEIIYALAQQDMIALRFVFRLGWALPNPVSGLDPDRLGVPFAYLEPATPITTYNATITINDADSDPVAGAFVIIGGARKKTNASGQAVFTLENGTYPVKAKNGNSVAEGSVTVNSGAASLTLTV